MTSDTHLRCSLRGLILDSAIQQNNFFTKEPCRAFVESTKRRSKPSGVACAAFLSSWLAYFASCGAHGGFPLRSPCQYPNNVQYSSLCEGCIVKSYAGTSACIYAFKRFKTGYAAQPKGSAHCKGPQDHLPIVRYACFVPVAGRFILTEPSSSCRRAVRA